MSGGFEMIKNRSYQTRVAPQVKAPAKPRPDLTGVKWVQPGLLRCPSYFVGHALAPWNEKASGKQQIDCVFGDEAMKIMSWRIGERIEIGITDDGGWLVCRRTNDQRLGYRISPRSIPAGQNAEMNQGKCIAGSARARSPFPDMTQGYKLRTFAREEVYIDLDASVLAMPVNGVGGAE